MFLPADTLVLCADLPETPPAEAAPTLKNPTLKNHQGSLISASVSSDGDKLEIEGSNLEEMLRTATNEITEDKKAKCTKLLVNGVTLDYSPELSALSVYEQISNKFTLTELDYVSLEIHWKNLEEAPQQQIDIIRMAHLIANEELRCIRFTVEGHTLEASPLRPPVDSIRRLSELKRPHSDKVSELPESMRQSIFA